MQQTLRKEIKCSGIGIHSGEIVTMIIRPAPANSGFTFVRTDLSGNNVIDVSFDSVTETTLSTTVSNAAGAKVSTIEHLMSAFWGCGIDNAIIEIDAFEVPIMDGSSAPFVALIEKAGIKIQNKPRRVIEILKPMKIEVDGKYLEFLPDSEFSVDFDVDFRIIGKQTYHYSESKTSYPHQVSRARTFGYIEEVEYLKSKGLAQGASLDNAIGISKDGVMNPEGLRYADEFARHKVLDCIGDLYVSGLRIRGKIKASQSGHALNNMALRKLFADESCFRITSEQKPKLVCYN